MTNNEQYHFHKAIDLMKNGNTADFVYEPGTAPYVCSWLEKEKRYFDLAAFIYFMYRVAGGLPDERIDSWNFWLRSRTDLWFKEYHLRNAILKHNPLRILDIDITDKEVFLNGGVIDLLGRSRGSLVGIEIKRKRHKHGLGQAIRYRSYLQEQEKKPVLVYIIGDGYPVDLLENNDPYIQQIGVISYVVVEDEILLIPWRKAAHA